MEAGADACHFFGASGMNRLAGLLLRMDADTAEELRYALNDATGTVETRK